MTSVAELLRPKPSNGFKDFPNLQKHHSHTEGNSLAPPYNASHQTSVFHPAVNSTANYPFFCGAFAQNWQTEYTEGMPLFICRQHTGNEKNRGTLTGRHVAHNIMASIPVINYYLMLGSSDKTFVDEYVKKYTLNKALIPHVSDSASTQEEKDQSFIDDFNKKWSFMGIIMNDMDINSRYQKLFNVTVRGRCRVFNLWTTRIGGERSMATARDRVSKGDELYLTLRKELVDPKHFVQPNGNAMSVWPTGSASNEIWQIKASRSSFSTTRRLTHYDKNGSRIHHYHVGKVLSAVSKKPDEHYQRKAFRQHKQMVSLPLIEVAVATGM